MLCLIAAALLLWQTRAGPAAQLLPHPGATAFAWMRSFPGSWAASACWCGIGSLALIAFAVIALARGWITNWVGGAPAPVNTYRQQVNIANSRCPTLSAMGPVGASRAARC